MWQEGNWELGTAQVLQEDTPAAPCRFASVQFAVVLSPQRRLSELVEGGGVTSRKNRGTALE